jgi:ankyrin repeat protein
LRLLSFLRKGGLSVTAEPFYNAPVKPSTLTVDIPRDTEGNTYLHELCARGAPVEFIREAVEKLGANVNAFNKKNLTPLGTAILSAGPEVVECLIALGADLYLPAPRKDTFFNAVYLAAGEGRTAALEKVIAHDGGLYVNAPGVNRYGNGADSPALHAAVTGGYYGMIAPLVAAGAFVNETAGWRKETPLLAAVDRNSAAAVQKLVESGADLERRAGVKNLTPLLHAVTEAKSIAAETLLRAGADPDARNAAGETALIIAAEKGDLYLTGLLLEAGAAPDLRGGENGETALLVAARKGNRAIAEALLKAGADPLLADRFNRTARQTVPVYDHHSGLRERLEEVENRALLNHFEKSYKKYRP